MSGGGLLHAASLTCSLACNVVVAMAVGFKDIRLIQVNVNMRQCEIKDIKFYQARTKIIALG